MDATPRHSNQNNKICRRKLKRKSAQFCTEQTEHRNTNHKRKTDKLNLIKIKSSSILKSWGYEKVCLRLHCVCMHLCRFKDLYKKMYKEFFQLSKTTIQCLKMGKRFEHIPYKGRHTKYP